MKIAANQLAPSYDLIVVGSGPAGLTLARKYAALTTKRVLVVESGPESGEQAGEQKAAQALAKVAASGDLKAGYYHYHSKRLFGGSSNIWAGLSATLERRSFFNDEWPMGYNELNRFYPEAAEILQLHPHVHTRPEAPLGGNGDIVYRPLHLSPPVRFNAKNRSLMDWLAADPQVDILFNHTATSVRIEQERAAGITARQTAPGAGKPLAIDADATVIAGGGIQNARLLKLSLPKDHPLPVGNYFASHPHINADHFGQAEIDADALQDAESKISGRTWAAFALSSGFCAANGLLSAAFVAPWERAPQQRNMLGKRKAMLSFKCLMRTEMPLLKENRIYLSETEKDPLGQPATRIDFKFPRKEIEDIHRAMAERLVKSGLGRISPLPYPPPPDDAAGIWNANSGGGHMLCSTRMGRSPDTSVVDSRCQVHGIRGLYVAGSSVFAAGEIANPTYTIVALALRLAHILAGGQRHAP